MNERLDDVASKVAPERGNERRSILDHKRIDCAGTRVRLDHERVAMLAREVIDRFGTLCRHRLGVVDSGAREDATHLQLAAQITRLRGAQARYAKSVTQTSFGLQPMLTVGVESSERPVARHELRCS